MLLERLPRLLDWRDNLKQAVGAPRDDARREARVLAPADALAVRRKPVDH
jgi:hypothetical protein